jgi:hypothetical protein
MHALAATEKGKHNGRSVDAYAREVGRDKPTVHLEVCASRVAQMSARADISNLLNRTRHLAEIHAAPRPCWPSLVKRLIENKWTVEQTNVAVKAVLACRTWRATQNSEKADVPSNRIPRLRHEAILNFRFRALS